MQLDTKTMDGSTASLHNLPMLPLPRAVDLVGASPKQIMLVMPGRIFRQGLELVLHGAGGHSVQHCESLDEAHSLLQANANYKPDLFVIGVDAAARATEDFARIRLLRETLPQSRWIVLGNSGGPAFWWQAVESRVDGLLHQDSPAEVLQLLVRLILLGYSFLPSSPLTSQAAGMGGAIGLAAMPDPVIQEVFPIAEPVANQREAGTPWRAGLSQRENDILRGLVAGQSNKSIARDLSISEATVKVHVKALLRKMQVTNRTQAAISALQFINKATPAGAELPPPPASAQ